MPAEYGGSNLGVTESALMMMIIAEKGAMTAASSIHMNIFGPNALVLNWFTRLQKYHLTIER